MESDKDLAVKSQCYSIELILDSTVSSCKILVFSTRRKEAVPPAKTMPKNILKKTRNAWLEENANGRIARNVVPHKEHLQDLKKVTLNREGPNLLIGCKIAGGRLSIFAERAFLLGARTL